MNMFAKERRYVIPACVIMVIAFLIGCNIREEMRMETLLKEHAMEKSPFDDMIMIGSGVRSMHDKEIHKKTNKICLCKMFAQSPDKFGVVYKIYGSKVLAKGTVSGIVDLFENVVSDITNNLAFGKCAVNVDMKSCGKNERYLKMRIVHDAASCEFKYKYP